MNNSSNLQRQIIISLSFAVAVILFVTPMTSCAIPIDVLLEGVDTPELQRELENRLVEVITALETGELDSITQHFTHRGLTDALDICTEVTLLNARSPQTSRLLTLPGGGFEIRDIKVQVTMGETSGNPYQFLVFSLSEDGLVDGIRFAMEAHHYQHLLEDAERLNDFAFRQRILEFVEIFRTAYNRKDIEYIQRVFSEDALIIVGRVIQEKPELPKQSDHLRNSSISRDRIEFVRKSKTEYISSLTNVFANNDFVRVEFDSLEITRHNNDQNLYGVMLKQHWRSSTYSDTGFVFLMLDFTDSDNPLIHVRSWQPDKFEDGTVISLYDFQVIR
ncbi:hypothetical protein K8I28_16660 [bacterium]|nr:hypothetical protein [bacterium]